MGIFDKWKKKSGEEGNIIYKHVEMNQQLFRDITQEVALYMFYAGFTSQPGLSFLRDDSGILNGLFIQHTTNPRILAIKNVSEDDYLQIVGMHAFGAGAYVTVKQLDFKHSVGEFTPEEVRQIALDFQETDAYELALNRLGVPLDSKEKNILDYIVLTGIKAAKASVGSEIWKDENMKAFMQVLFNAGVSMYMLRRIN